MWGVAGGMPKLTSRELLPQSYCTATVTSVFQVMSTLSPTSTLSSTVGSTICRLYFGPVKVIDDALLSIASTVAVIVLCTDAVPPGRASCPAVVVPVCVSTGASPGGFSLAETLLLNVTDTLSPPLSSSNRFAPAGTSTVSKLPSAFLMFTMRLVYSMGGTVPERVTVCVGSCLTSCAQLGRERAKTNPDAPRIAFTRFMYLSPLA